jgi:alkanesulfonate monooxygenase SsuD/methylene tetrahydromethanopterin reductase-like flavin-dependent oxidoreductase (luciferase family)
MTCQSPHLLLYSPLRVAEEAGTLDLLSGGRFELGLGRGANMVIERFVAIGETEDQAERNLDQLTQAFGQFLTLYAAGGRRPVPATDGEFQTARGTGKPNRPAIAVSGTPAGGRGPPAGHRRDRRAAGASRPSPARRRACSPAR